MWMILLSSKTRTQKLVPGALQPHEPHIQFSTEETRPDGSMPFLDTLIILEQDRTLSTTVYRKPIHTDQYLHWHSQHNLYAECSVFNTLTYRTRTVYSNPQLQQNNT